MTLNLSLDQNDHNYWEELSQVLKKDDFDLEKIKVAYDFAKKAHEGQKRKSGEAFLSHPVWVAKIIAQMGVGEEAVISALLHDCIEDTTTTVEEISDKFGDEVALLVTGLTEVKKKTSGIEIHKTNVDVFRRFLFSSVNDVRVLIIRLADKLHNGMTISSLSKESQIKYAKRVLGIYGPVAEYVGLHYFRKRLDDIAFKILYPKESKRLEKILRDKERDEIKALNIVKNDIDKIFKLNNILNFKIEGRIKSLYSTYIKIKKKGEEGVMDRVGLRVFTESVSDCYKVLGILHAKYEYLAEEFDDYISSPKPNGYRSIQTTLNWKDKTTVEVQIRTFEMHEFNEFGPASHIAYKMSSNEGKGYEWVKDLVLWQKDDNNIKNYRINVLNNFIYVFTPKGDTIQMPKNSTALDFAYRVHTDIGDHCSGILINQKMGKISDCLETGDMVEVIVGKKLNVNKNWLDIVRTKWAKEHVRRVTLENDHS
ncbi:HD domain-containing protein [Patescibacteria group bacterium]|nr:HD domain-containing protein [Patescibacteria group bacterium]